MNMGKERRGGGRVRAWAWGPPAGRLCGSQHGESRYLERIVEELNGEVE